MLHSVLSAMHVACLRAIKAGGSIVLCVLRKAVGLKGRSIDSRADRCGVIVSHGRCVLRDAWAATVSGVSWRCKIRWHRPAVTSLSDSQGPVVHRLMACERGSVLQSDSKLQVAGVAGPPSILYKVSHKQLGHFTVYTYLSTDGSNCTGLMTELDIGERVGKSLICIRDQHRVN